MRIGRLSERRTRWLLNFFPPWLFQGIRIVSIGPGFRTCRVRVRRWLPTANQNGTTFGGTIYSSFDPIYQVLYWQSFLRRGVPVDAWTKSASIRFLKPVETPLTIDFSLSEEEIETAARALEGDGRFARTHRVEAFDAKGALCAEAEIDIVLRLRIRKTPAS